MPSAAGRQPGLGYRQTWLSARRHAASRGQVPVFRQIVVCVDGSPRAEVALAHAQHVAHAGGATITLVCVIERGSADRAAWPPPDPLEWELRRTSMRTYLDGLCGRPRDPSIQVKGEIVQGDPAEQIAACVARMGADLLVLATHGAGDCAQYGLGRTAARLVEQVAVSLLLVPGDLQHATPPTKVCYRRILVPLDGSARAESALPIVQMLGHEADVEYLLAHVIPTPEIMPAEPPEPEDLELLRNLQRRNEVRAQRYLNRLQAQLATGGVRARAMVLPGPCPRRALAGLLAREHVDLIAVSSHGQSARTEDALGSVASHLVRTHAAPTLVVRGSDVAGTRRHTTVSEVEPVRVGPALR